ncbi:MAG: PSD1 domain-containing protein [Verrucomicrobiae bacterium]|nr:PSD1 domain-containing protein [Verrucomicrobiae bacterium]
MTLAKRILLTVFLLPEGADLYAAPIDFVRDIRPIFEAKCYDCHSGDTRKSGLRLDVKAAAMKGGDHHGPDIVPGKPEDSPLIHFVTTDKEDELMPPKGGRLVDREIGLLTRWIAEGAVWPEGVDSVILDDPADHWSFKPLLKAPAEASVDFFIDAKLAENGLRRSPPADSSALLRRLSLDLTGLPPDAAIGDPPSVIRLFEGLATDHRSPGNPREWASIVDEMLASPHYGERWAQHWLDVVRYADTHGFEVNTERPYAFPYRDYVIDAINADLPYDRFIREQIAGDALGVDAATGFLVTASVLLPGQIGKDAPSMRLARQDSLDEIVTNIGQTFLGLSVGCARCHDHKFDPISARDYYGMQAFVAGVEYADRELRTPAALRAKTEAAALKKEVAELDERLLGFVPLAKSGATRAMVSARQNLDRFIPVKAKRVRFTILSTNRLEPCIDELEVFGEGEENHALASNGAEVRSSGDIIVADRHDLKYLNDGRYGNSRSWMGSATSGSWVEVEFPGEVLIDRVVWGRDREGKFKDRLAIDYRIEAAGTEGEWILLADASDRRSFEEGGKESKAASTEGLSPAEAAEVKELRGKRDRLEREAKAKEGAILAFAGRFREPDEIHLLRRGDPEQPEEPVPPMVPAALGRLVLDPATPEQKRRLALADWIARADNPLTARVMVNRIWQGHFGRGLVASPNDFGNNGMPPSHLELLDWLAGEFIRSGWSMKHIHRLILMSETYRQGSVAYAEGSAIDADNHLLWRFPARRVEAEVIRDSILAVSGRLDLKRYGRGFDLFDKRGGLSGFNPVESPTGEGLRRMIYAHKVRREPEAVFGAFDCPDAGQAVGQRRESTTPIQALNLFNSRFVIEQAEAFAKRVSSEAGEGVEDRIRRAYRLALFRDPSREELADAVPVVAGHGIAVFARALFNSNEFLFVP